MNTVRIADLFPVPAIEPQRPPVHDTPTVRRQPRGVAVNELHFHGASSVPRFEASSAADRAVCALLGVAVCGAVFAGVLASFAHAAM